MSEQLWYYIDQSQAQIGPITIPDLQALVANNSITPETIVWTEALGEQWIPACNVEGLFPEGAQVLPDPNTATVGVKVPSEISQQALAQEMAQAAAPPVPAPSLRAPGAVQPAQAVTEPQQPQMAPTTPMIPSTPTTQPVPGTAAPLPSAVANTAAGAVAGAVGAVASAASVAADAVQDTAGEVADAVEKKGKSVLGIILLVLGLGVAGTGGYLFSQEGGSNLNYGLLGGGGVVAILGLIMTLKGKKVPPPMVIPSSPALTNLGGTAAVGNDGVVHPGTVDLSAVADVAPIPAGTAPVAIKAPVNPLLGANAPAAATPAAAAAAPSPFAGVHAATKPNPLLANAAAAAPQNKLNVSLPATPAASAEPPADNPS